jgi:hypothetical protein
MGGWVEVGTLKEDIRIVERKLGRAGSGYPKPSGIKP